MKKYMLSAAAVVLAVGASAFTTISSGRFNNNWVFQGTQTSQILDASQYQMNASVPANCGQGTKLPCSISLPNTVTQSNIDQYFSSHFSSNQDVLNASPQKRPL